MTCIVYSGHLSGIEGVPVEVEIDLLRRLPAISIVGLAGSAVRESADRVRSAIHHSGFEFPRKRVVVNLAPADLPKDGSAFDLPIAVGILCAAKLLPNRFTKESIFVGELSLSGRLRPIKGALSIAIMALKSGKKKLVLPAQNAAETQCVEGLEIIAAKDIQSVILWMQSGSPPEVEPVSKQRNTNTDPDLSSIQGQHKAKRALEVAAAGSHNVLMIGPPGCGKTMLAKCLPALLPKPSFQESIEITQIHSAAGIHIENGLITQRPFRAPHHSMSTAAMVGNSRLVPGEISLAHHGVLFLDELPEYRRDVLESLRGPLESHQVLLSRAAGQAKFPARFMLVATANPCPCGFATDPFRPCGCSTSEIRRYRDRISGPLIDRIDIQLNMHPVSVTELLQNVQPEASEVAQCRITKARQNKTTRQLIKKDTTEVFDEFQLIRQSLDSTTEDRLKQLALQHHVSARGLAKILRVARSIADLENAEHINESHLVEATAYRIGLPSEAICFG